MIEGDDEKVEEPTEIRCSEADPVAVGSIHASDYTIYHYTNGNLDEQS